MKRSGGGRFLKISYVALVGISDNGDTNGEQRQYHYFIVPLPFFYLREPDHR